MTVPLYEKIRRLLDDRPQLTQRGLAARMGVNPAAVNRMLYGRRKIMADDIPVIEEYLGERLDVHAGSRGGNAGAPPQVPVYGFSAAHKKEIQKDIVDWVSRHPEQFGIEDAFAFYVADDDMQPRYFSGEIVYLHPGRPIEANRDALIEMKDNTVLLRRLTRVEKDALHTKAYAQDRSEKIDRTKIHAVYAVVGRG